jgi:hypothetical protein
MADDAASRAGKENISRDDMVIPRVALMQAVSPEAMEGKAEIGHFYHTVAEEDLGPELDIIAILHTKRYTLWNPRHSGGGVLARATDGKHWDNDWKGEIAPYKDRPRYKVQLEVKKGEPVGRDIGLGKWGTMDPDNEDSPPAATLTHALLCVAPDHMELGPFVVLLQRSAEPVAKQLLSKIAVDPAPIFGQVYTMKSKDQPSDAGGFKQFVFVKNGHVQDAGLYEFLKEQHEMYKATEVKYDEQAEQPDDAKDAGDGGSDRY